MRTRPPALEIRRLKRRMPGDRDPDHLQPMRQRRPIAPLMRRFARDHEPDPVQPTRLAALLGQDQVPDMNRVKRTAKKPEPHDRKIPQSRDDPPPQANRVWQISPPNSTWHQPPRYTAGNTHAGNDRARTPIPGVKYCEAGAHSRALERPFHQGRIRMKRMVLHSRVGSDGVLHVTVPIGKEDADREVRVTIDPVPPPMTPEEWQQFILSTAGAWQGDLERPEQGEYDVRDELP